MNLLGHILVIHVVADLLLKWIIRIFKRDKSNQ